MTGRVRRTSTRAGPWLSPWICEVSSRRTCWDPGWSVETLTSMESRCSGGVALPGVPGREHRGLAYVEIETRQGGLIFGNIHLGRSPAERSAQAEFVAEWLTSRSLPTILAGDFNMIPDSPEYRCLVAVATDVTAGLDLVTFPDDVPDRQRDYVFITAGLRAGSVATIDSDLSDHRPVIVEIEFSS